MTKPYKVCDRHTRQHARLNNTHAVYYKLNTSELFCQACVDWVRKQSPKNEYTGLIF